MKKLWILVASKGLVRISRQLPCTWRRSNSWLNPSTSHTNSCSVGWFVLLLVHEEILLAGLCERKILFRLKIYDRLRQTTAKRTGRGVTGAARGWWSCSCCCCWSLSQPQGNEASKAPRREVATPTNRQSKPRACLDFKKICAVPVTLNLAAHTWSTKYKRKKKLIAQLGEKSRDETFKPN